MTTTPRLRLFGGPNGSGKTTIKSVISHRLLNIFIDPDQIEKEMRETAALNLQQFQINTTGEELFDFFSNSQFLIQAGYGDQIANLHFSDHRLSFQGVETNAYFASVAADFIRTKLLSEKKSFSFETVMSFPDKVDILRKAQKMGYRTYLYYVATDDPQINISRVNNRVQLGGHPVPEDKIVSRYYRSLQLLMEAVRATNRAYIFDNSGHEHLWIAEVTEGRQLEMKVDFMPGWFKKALWDKFSALAI